jgi:hypothetical protein
VNLDDHGMAKITVVTVTDDIDGSADAQTVTFGLGAQAYEIDLGKKNLAALKKGLQPYIDAGRPVGRRNAARPGRSRKASATDSSAVRAWATANGIEISHRGRIPAAVIAKYEAAH